MEIIERKTTIAFLYVNFSFKNMIDRIIGIINELEEMPCINDRGPVAKALNTK